jgi:hypothetical protein
MKVRELIYALGYMRSEDEVLVTSAEDGATLHIVSVTEEQDHDTEARFVRINVDDI